MVLNLDRLEGEKKAAAVGLYPSVSVVVPTYYEAENIPHLVERLEGVQRKSGLRMELLIVDDDSKDGTPQVVEALGRPWVKLIVRTKDKGLSQAVVEGLSHARNEVVVVMDADLSHPPEKIPEMLDRLAAGADFVIGSRYVEGGTQDTEWGFFRWLNSKVATLLSRPFTRVKDPMSGFFAFRLESLKRSAPLDPVGYKIGLELIVKGRFRRVEEIPIHFSQRKFGKSKLTLKEQLLYLRHLGRLFAFKFFHRPAARPAKAGTLEQDLETGQRKSSMGA